MMRDESRKTQPKYTQKEWDNVIHDYEADYRAMVIKMESENDKLRKLLEESESEIETLKYDKDQLKSDLMAAYNERDEYMYELSSANATVEEKNQEIVELENAVAEAHLVDIKS
jgi:uncharacterized coiled-coil DUF342 family protein